MSGARLMLPCAAWHSRDVSGSTAWSEMYRWLITMTDEELLEAVVDHRRYRQQEPEPALDERVRAIGVGEIVTMAAAQRFVKMMERKREIAHKKKATRAANERRRLRALLVQ